MYLKHWYSYLMARCFWCKSTKNTIYIFQGCGKYHHTLMCDQCLQKKIQKKLQHKKDNSYYPINSDPYGMEIKRYHSIFNL